MSSVYETDDRFSLITNFDSVPKDIPLAVDTETTYHSGKGGLIRFIKGNPNNYPFLLTLSDGERGWCVEVNDNTIPLMREFFKQERTWIFYHASYDIIMLDNIGVGVVGTVRDVMLMHRLVVDEDRDTEGRPIFGLKGISCKYLTPDADKYELAVDAERFKIARKKGIPKAEVTFDMVDPILMLNYACADTLYTAQLYFLFMDKIREDELGRALEIEHRCLPAITATEMAGMKIDVASRDALHAELTEIIQESISTAYGIAGKEFNLDSADELVGVLTELGVDYTTRTDKGAYRTDVATLEYVAKTNPGKPAELVEAVLEYRASEKLRGTFVDAMYKYLQKGDRIHATFWQAGARTGRMSSAEPNFQNLPKRRDDRIRGLFVPAEGYIFVMIDYSQEEYRILAHYAQDDRLISAIRKGWDIHKATAAQVYDVNYEEVTGEQRASAKTLNFGLIYGLGNAALANQLGYPIDEALYKQAHAVFRRFNIKPWALPELDTLLARLHTEDDINAIKYFYGPECQSSIGKAQSFKNTYFNRFTGVKEFIYNCRNVAKNRGYIFNWVGRRRRFDNPAQESYKAPNALIQGGCSDILKDRGAAVYEFFKLNKAKSRIVNWVHDELVFEWHKEELDMIPVVVNIMEDLPFRVPITVDVDWSDTAWNEKKPFTSVKDLKDTLGL